MHLRLKVLSLEIERRSGMSGTTELRKHPQTSQWSKEPAMLNTMTRHAHHAEMQGPEAGSLEQCKSTLKTCVQRRLEPCH